MDGLSGLKDTTRLSPSIIKYNNKITSLRYVYINIDVGSMIGSMNVRV